MLGHQHNRVTVLTTPFVGSLSLVLLLNLYSDILYCLSLSLLASVSYWIGGIYFSPDLDSENTLPTKRWGKLKFIWCLYPSLVRHHRSHLSHFTPILPTAIRLFYFSLWLSPIFIVLDHLNIYLLDLLYIYTHYKFELLTIFLSVELSAITHYICDILYSRYGVGKK